MISICIFVTDARETVDDFYLYLGDFDLETETLRQVSLVFVDTKTKRRIIRTTEKSSRREKLVKHTKPKMTMLRKK